MTMSVKTYDSSAFLHIKFLPSFKAEKLHDSPGKKKHRFIFLVVGDNPQFELTHAIACSKMSKNPQKSPLFKKNLYANIKVIEDGVAGYVRVSLNSLNKRTGIELFQLQVNANINENRDLTSFLKNEMGKKGLEEVAPWQGNLPKIRGLPKLQQAKILFNQAKNTKDKKKRERLLKRSARKNYAPAMFRLFHFYGTDSKMDLKKRTYYLKKAALAGHVHGQLYYGLLLFNANPTSARLWLRTSAKNGSAAAAILLTYHDLLIREKKTAVAGEYLQALWDARPKKEVRDGDSFCVQMIKSRRLQLKVSQRKNEIARVKTDPFLEKNREILKELMELYNISEKNEEEIRSDSEKDEEERISDSELN